MNPKITIPVVIIISVIATIGIMYSLGFEQQQAQVSQKPSPEIIYVNNSSSEFFKGTQEIKKYPLMQN